MVSLNQKFSFRIIFRFVAWMFRIDPKRTPLLFLFKFLISMQSAVQLFVFSQVVNHAVAVYELSNTLQSLLLWIGIWGAINILIRIVIPFITILFDKLMQELEDALNQQLQEKVHRLSLEALERSDFHDQLNRAMRAAEPSFMLQLTNMIFEIFVTSIKVVSVAVVVGLWNPWLLATLVLVTVPAPIAQWIETQIKFRLEKKHIPNSRLMHYLAHQLDSTGPAKEIRVFQMSAWLLKWWDKLYWTLSDATFKQELKMGLISVLLTVLSLAGLAGSIAWSAWEVAHNRLSTGQLAGMLIALQVIQGSTNSLFGRISYIMEFFFRIGDFFTYMDLGPEESRRGAEKVESIGDIQAEGVTFTYPQVNVPAIDNLSFTIKSGEKIALVGENGSGKTTLVKLLIGLYTPTMGKIHYDQHDLSQIDLEQARKKMAAVFQDFNQYAVSLQDNIGFGEFELKDDLSIVETAAEKGGAAAVAQQLLQGYATQLTTQFTGGMDLSGGQWQKVAISRAFMRNAELVALDEPTAALDPKAEADVFRNFMEIVGDKTAVLVSHRLGITRFCDRIFVMKGGRLAEQGTHEELLSLQGEYARMWGMQSVWYKPAPL